MGGEALRQVEAMCVCPAPSVTGIRMDRIWLENHSHPRFWGTDKSLTVSAPPLLPHTQGPSSSPDCERPVLLALLSSGRLVTYQAFTQPGGGGVASRLLGGDKGPSSSSSGDGVPPPLFPGLAFRRLDHIDWHHQPDAPPPTPTAAVPAATLAAAKSTASTAAANAPGLMLRRPRLVRFDDVTYADPVTGEPGGARQSGVFVCGERPMWLFASRGGLVPHPMAAAAGAGGDGAATAVTALTPFHNQGCQLVRGRRLEAPMLIDPRDQVSPSPLLFHPATHHLAPAVTRAPCLRGFCCRPSCPCPHPLCPPPLSVCISFCVLQSFPRPDNKPSNPHPLLTHMVSSAPSPPHPPSPHPPRRASSSPAPPPAASRCACCPPGRGSTPPGSRHAPRSRPRRCAWHTSRKPTYWPWRSQGERVG